MVDSELNQQPAKKKTPAKKKVAVKKKATPHAVDSFKVFEDPTFLKPAQSMDRDLVKILARNPFQAYVFWKVHPGHFDRIRREFDATSEADIQLKLKLEYFNQNGKQEESWYDLAPMTKSYFCNFSAPVSRIRAFVYANYHGRLRLFLETADGDLPPGVESFHLDKEWIHPKWIEFGWVKEDKKGHWHFTDSYDSQGKSFFDEELFSAGFDGSSRTSSRASSHSFSKDLLR